jgi:hypothetical protein
MTPKKSSRTPQKGSGQIAGPTYLHQLARDVLAGYDYDKDRYAAKQLHRRRKNALRKNV